MNDQPKNPGTGIPKWLLYGFIAKLVIVVAIVLAVMVAAGVFG